MIAVRPRAVTESDSLKAFDPKIRPRLTISCPSLQAGVSPTHGPLQRSRTRAEVCQRRSILELRRLRAVRRDRDVRELRAGGGAVPVLLPGGRVHDVPDLDHRLAALGRDDPLARG